MRIVTGLAVTGMMLVLASPAAAQGRRVEGGERTSIRAMPRAADDRAATRAGRDYSPPADTQLLGSLPVGESAAFDLGIVPILGATPRELARRRTDLSREMAPPQSRIAALRFSLRF